jgi:hypothetical protein
MEGAPTADWNTRTVGTPNTGLPPPRSADAPATVGGAVKPFALACGNDDVVSCPH